MKEKGFENTLDTDNNPGIRQAIDKPSAPWTTAYSREQEHSIKRSNLIATIPKMTKKWRVSFEVKPRDYNSPFASVLHLTIGNKGGRIGDRTPAIWFHKERGVIVSTAMPMDGVPSFIKAFKPSPPLGEWTKLVISQDFERNLFVFSFNIGNKTVFPGCRIVPSCHPGWGAVFDLGGSFAERGFKIGHRHCGTTTRAIKTAPFN